jgi:hypothetical protein
MVLQFEFSNRTRSLSRASLSRRDGTVCDSSEDVVFRWYRRNVVKMRKWEMLLFSEIFMGWITFFK